MPDVCEAMASIASTTATKPDHSEWVFNCLINVKSGRLKPGGVVLGFNSSTQEAEEEGPSWVEAGVGASERQADLSYNERLGLNEGKEGEKGKNRWFIFTAFKCNALIN